MRIFGLLFSLSALKATPSEEIIAFSALTSVKPNDGGDTPVSWKASPSRVCEREPFPAVSLNATSELSPFKMQRVSLNKVTG